MKITPSAQRLTFRDLETNLDFQSMLASSPKGHQVLLEVVASELQHNHNQYLEASDAVVLNKLDAGSAGTIRGRTEAIKELFGSINRKKGNDNSNGTTSTTTSGTSNSTNGTPIRSASTDIRDSGRSYFSKPT